MGKFSKPRKNFLSSDETTILPNIPAEPENAPAEAAPAADIPEPQDAFDSFDTEPAPRSRKGGKIILISLFFSATMLLLAIITLRTLDGEFLSDRLKARKASRAQ